MHFINFVFSITILRTKLFIVCAPYWWIYACTLHYLIFFLIPVPSMFFIHVSVFLEKINSYVICKWTKYAFIYLRVEIPSIFNLTRYRFSYRLEYLRNMANVFVVTVTGFTVIWFKIFFSPFKFMTIHS